MEKHLYETPTMEVTSFSTTDVMLASSNKGYQTDPFESNPFEGGNV